LRGRRDPTNEAFDVTDRRAAPIIQSLPSAGFLLSAAMSSPSALHLHHLRHWHHPVVQVIHDPNRTADNECVNQYAECGREYVVGVVRSRGACADLFGGAFGPNGDLA